MEFSPEDSSEDEQMNKQDLELKLINMKKLIE
jgi:hypothetical protein